MTVAEAEQVARDASAASAEEQPEQALTRSQKMAITKAARAFGSYGDAKKAMAVIAKAIVAMRLTFEKDGRPDFRGETPQYRGAIASLYEAAIPDDDERASFKVAIRYWVSKEFDARVDAGKIARDELEAVGIFGRSNGIAPASSPPSEREPRRAATAAEMTPTGVMVGGAELTPPEVLVEAERIVTEHVANESLGVVMTLQSIGRELGPVVAAVRNPDIRDKLPGRALSTSAEQLLILALDCAHLSGVEVEEFVASWYSQVLDTEHATAGAAA